MYAVVTRDINAIKPTASRRVSSFHPGLLAEMFQTKRKRSSYTAQFKLKVISYAEETSNRAAAYKFSVSEKLVSDWRKAKASLEEEPKEKKARREKLTR